MVFSSIFKNEIKNFLEIIKSTKARNTYLHYRNSLQEFDLYLSSIEYKDKKLNREIIDCWIATIKGKPSTVQGKVIHIKYFLRYLNEIDIGVECLNEAKRFFNNMIQNKSKLIFSDIICNDSLRMSSVIPVNMLYSTIYIIYKLH